MSKNEKYTEAEKIKQIESLSQLFRESRSHFPYIPDDAIGKPDVELSFNLFNGVVHYGFREPLTLEQQTEFNRQGHFLNQNFIVRLFGVLQYHGVFDSFDRKRYRKLDILKRLRNIFGHGTGKYNPNNPRHRKLLKDTVEVFNLDKKDYQDFVISIDTVITPIVNESIQAVKELNQRPKKSLSFLSKFINCLLNKR